LTSCGYDSQKSTDQKTINRLKATFYKALVELHPRYPQPAPQQTGTSQKPRKTAICSGFMSRFSSMYELFSTISTVEAQGRLLPRRKKAPSLRVEACG
jgi:hypothetical protein